MKVKSKNPGKFLEWLESGEGELEQSFIDELVSSSIIYPSEFVEKSISAIIFVCSNEEVQTIVKENLGSLDLDFQFILMSDIKKIQNHSGFFLVIQEHLELQKLDNFDQWAHENNAMWMPLGIIELDRISIGPLIIPSESPCIECWSSRRLANSNPADASMRIGMTPNEHPKLTDGELSFLLSFLKIRIVTLSQQFQQVHLGIITSFSRNLMQFAEDKILFAPRCGRCLSHEPPFLEPYTPFPREN